MKHFTASVASIIATASERRVAVAHFYAMPTSVICGGTKNFDENGVKIRTFAFASENVQPQLSEPRCI